MDKIKDFVKRANTGSKDYDFWIKLHNDIKAFREDPNTTEKEIEELRRKVHLSKIGMIYDGIMRKRKNE